MFCTGTQQCLPGQRSSSVISIAPRRFAPNQQRLALLRIIVAVVRRLRVRRLPLPRGGFDPRWLLAARPEFVAANDQGHNLSNCGAHRVSCWSADLPIAPRTLAVMAGLVPATMHAAPLQRRVPHWRNRDRKGRQLQGFSRLLLACGRFDSPNRMDGRDKPRQDAMRAVRESRHGPNLSLPIANAVRAQIVLAKIRNYGTLTLSSDRGAQAGGSRRGKEQEKDFFAPGVGVTRGKGRIPRKRSKEIQALFFDFLWPGMV